MHKLEHDDPGVLHWEQLVRTMIEILGADRFDEIVSYVIAEMNAERARLYHFAVETRRAHP